MPSGTSQGGGCGCCATAADVPGQPKPKTGHTSKLVNNDIIGTVVLLVVCCVFGATQNAVMSAGYAPTEPWYLADEEVCTLIW